MKTRELRRPITAIAYELDTTNTTIYNVLKKKLITGVLKLDIKEVGQEKQQQLMINFELSTSQG